MGMTEDKDSDNHGHVKQKKRVVAPTRKVVAADTGTYRLGRNGRGGAEAGTPTPPPTPPPLKPGIRDRERGEEDTERGRYLPSTYCKVCSIGQNGEYGVCLGGGAMTTDWKRTHYAKQQLNENMKDSPCPDTKCPLALIYSSKTGYSLYSNIQLYLHVYSLL